MRRSLADLSQEGKIGIAVIIAVASFFLATGLFAFGQESYSPGKTADHGPALNKDMLNALDKDGCGSCHEEYLKSWAQTPHRRTVGAPQLKADKQGCVGCHRGADKHLEDPSAFQPRAQFKTAKENSDLCLSCHKSGKQAMWRSSKHSFLKEGCNTCHDPHNPNSRYMLKDDEPGLCAKCHPKQIAEGQLPSHHPIAEGKMVCSDCHNVHGDQRGNLPRENNPEMCYRCHAEKEGPFVNEHPPVTENCVTCHRPHGSPNDYMLQVEQPMLCLQCHAGHSDSHRSPLVSVDPNNPAQTIAGIDSFYSKCTACHTHIHGTDLNSQTGNGTFMPGRPSSPAGTTNANKGAGALALAGTALLGNLSVAQNWDYFGFAEPWIGDAKESGSRQFVREYDGKNYGRPQLDSETTMLTKKDALNVRTLNLGQKDQEVDLYYANPQTSVDVKYQELTHRFGRFNFPPDALIGGNSVTHEDLTNGFNRFGIERRNTDAKMSYRAKKLPSVRWNLGYWSEQEKGRKQTLFLDRCNSCHQVSTTQEIDRITSEVNAGLDLSLGSSSLSYNHLQRKFENDAPEQFFNFQGSRIFNGLAPLFGVADTVMTYDEVRGQSPATDNLYFNALYRNGKRENRYSDLNLNFESFAGNSVYYLGDGARFIGGYSTSRLSPQGDEPVDRKIRNARGEFNYFAIPNLDVSVGFQREDADRSTDRAMVPLQSDSNIWNARADWTPDSRFSLRLQYKTIDAENKRTAIEAFVPARLIGNPTDSRNWQVLANYMASNRMTLTGIYSEVKDQWDVSAEGLSKSSDQDLRTAGLSLSYIPTKRAHLNASYYHQKGESNSDVTYGQGTFTLVDVAAFPPIDSVASFDYTANILNLRGDYAFNPRWRMFGAYNRTATDGSILARDIGDYIDQNPDLNGVALTFHPFDTTIIDWWLGVGYQLSPRDQLTLSHQFRRWQNNDNTIENGDLRVWRVGWRRQF